MKKLFKFFSITGILSVLLVANVFAGEWRKESGKWKYFEPQAGGYVKNQVISDGGVKYIIDASGNMISGNGSVMEFKSSYYKVNSNGSAYIAEGWSHLNNETKRWSFFKNGKLQKNKWIDSKGDFIQNDYNSSWPYYVDSNGYTYKETNSIAIRDSKGNNIQYKVKSDGACIPLSGEDKETSQNKMQWKPLGGGDYAFYYQGKPYVPTKNNKRCWIDKDGNINSIYSKDKYCYYVITSDGKMLRNCTQIIENITYTFGDDGKGVINKSGKKEKDGFLGLFGNYKQKWIQEGSNWFLMDIDGSYIKNMWANSIGDKASSKFSSTNCYRADSSGKLIQYVEFEVDGEKYKADGNGKATKITSKENKKDNTSNEKKDQDSKSSDLNTRPDGSLPKNPNEGWVDLGNGDWALYLAGSYIKGQWFSENATNNWYYLNSKGIMLRNCYVYPADSLGSKLTLDSTKAVTTASGEPIKYYFNNNGAWSLSNIINVDGTDLSQLPPAQALSFLTKQEKKDIKNKKDEDVENEIAIPIEIYTKDQFYKGKFSTGQISENEYLTNGYYIYNKGNGKYTLYKANDTIGKTSKAIKSNTTLAKITDYLDDNDIEKSAEIKAKEGSSSSKDKSSSKISKKITVTIKSGYKTKDKIVNEIDYEGSYTLPTFEEMNWEEKPKYTFSHWAIGSKKYNPGDTIDNIKSKKTITAKWKKN